MYRPWRFSDGWCDDVTFSRFPLSTFVCGLHALKFSVSQTLSCFPFVSHSSCCHEAPCLSPDAASVWRLSWLACQVASIGSGGSSEPSDNQNLCSLLRTRRVRRERFAAKSQTHGKGYPWLQHTAPCALYIRAFGDGHRLENNIHVGGSRFWGRNGRKGWRLCPGPSFLCVSHPAGGFAGPGEAVHGFCFRAGSGAA